MTNEEITVYHNPRCSKSRKTVELLEAGGASPRLYLYLEENPDRHELTRVMTRLGIDDPRGMMRRKEHEYEAMRLDDASATQLLDAMVQIPKLIERPIVIRGDR